MTTPPVPSITDEQLAELESIIGAADEEYPQRAIYASLIARLRAAETDAARYRWLRGRLPGSAYRIAGVIYSEGGDGVDVAIDTAMEHHP